MEWIRNGLYPSLTGPQEPAAVDLADVSEWPEWLTPRQAVKMSGLTERCLRYWANRGQVDNRWENGRCKRRRNFRRDDVNALVTALRR